MSNFLRTRIVAIELLTKCCKHHVNGSNKLLEAMSSVKLIFGESVRFKFLVSMLNGGGKNSIVFQRVSLTFINTLLESCCRSADRVRIQCELEEAGFDINCMEDKFHECKVAPNDRLWIEVRKWKEMYLDVQLALREYQTKSRENIKLLQEVDNLRDTIKKMEEDKMNLLKTEKELKEKCDKLHQQLRDFKNNFKNQPTSDLSLPEFEEETYTDSGRFSNDKEENIRQIPLAWKYPPLPQSKRTVIRRSRSSERKQKQLSINRSRSENRVTPVTSSNDRTNIDRYKHCDGFFFKPNVRFSSVTTTSVYKPSYINNQSNMVHKEIARAVKEIGGWL
ncbi:uncharacterized protein [Centruroides vittatus]|uniref:uncharacterized protein n=1 Tax=Centruroides vittatus TaxID=120091 RepID=UPI00350FE928